VRTDEVAQPTDPEGGKADMKAVLRRRVLTARAAMGDAARAEASAAICRRLATLPELVGVRAVLGYAAFGTEVDVDPWLRRALAEGFAVHLPWVAGDALGVARVGDLDEDLAPGWRGVREPPPGRRRTVQPRLLDLVVAPGVAFDRSGARLGYGGGHFDRLLSRLRPGVPVIGVAFAVQLVDRVPHEPHDRRVDVVVTEHEVLRPG